MPLPTPTEDTPWPPKLWEPIRQDIAEWDVWYSGDADRLAAFYAPASKDQRRWRMPFWGRPATDPTRPEPKRVHMPLAAGIAEAAADLLFGETPVFEAEGSTDELAELVEVIGLGPLLIEGAELASGLGGVFLVPAWDRSVSDRPFLRVVDADLGIPEFGAGRLTAVTFWTDVETDDEGTWRHLERYEVRVDTEGRATSWMLHGLYRGDKDHLGIRMPLMAKAQTKRYANADGLGETNLTELLGLTRCLASWVPNTRPNRKRRKHPLGRWMGRADTAGLESMMAMLDRSWSALDRDIDLGKARVIIPEQYLQRDGRGSGAWFDADQEVFSPVNVPPNDRSEVGIETVQPEIRTETLVAASQAVFDAVVAGAGYSNQSLGRDAEGGVKTATQVDAEGSLSDRTTDKKRKYWEPRLCDALEVLMMIDRKVFSGAVEPVRPTVSWPEHDQDQRDLASILNLISLAKAASTETKVRMLNREWDDTEVEAEVDRIRAEESLQTGDPTGFGV